MRKVQCYNCGKRYDFDMDDFCPGCGAFNPPEKGTGGATVRTDGLNEKNHVGSFVHREFHAENRVRKAVGLSKGVSRSASPARPPVKQRQEGGKKKTAPVVFWIIIVIVMINILSSLLGLLFG